MLPLLAVLTLVPLAPRAEGADLFRARVAPLLTDRCLPCHGARQAKGGLSFEGGAPDDRVLVPGDPDGSALLALVTGPAPEMPKDGARLTEEEVQVLREWIAAGAAWVEGEVSARHWWSLRPLGDVAPPELPAEWRALSRGPLDDFVLDELRRHGLRPSPPADRRTLLRRLHFDLVGLPPDPACLARFLADGRPDAYEREVDRLLASPQYGERWARHWLDVVHYADTHGYDKDKPRPNAWPYRDWVVRALNDDLPWTDFVLAQLAGDVLGPSGSDVVATGMLAAGPWDFVGHVELREGTTDKLETRNLDRDDVVTNVMSSFQSLTVHCARCHDHKFDPVTQREYYDLQAVFAGVERAERDYDPDPSVAAARVRLSRERDALQVALARAAEALDARLQADARPTSVELRAARAQAAAALAPPDRSGSMGYHSALEARPDVPKWVQVDLGRPVAIDSVALYPCDEVYGGHPGPGFGLPDVLEVHLGAAAEGAWETAAVWDRAAAPLGHADRPIVLSFDRPRTARYVRVVAPRLWERTADYCFALAELEVLAGGANVAYGRPVEALDSIEAGARWGRAMLVDGARPWSAELERADELDAAWTALRAGLETAEEAARRARDGARLAEVQGALAVLPPPRRVYAVAREFVPEGSFTPPPGGAPRAVHRLERGDVRRPAEPSVPGALEAPGHAPATFDLPPGADEGQRRLALARWIAHPENPLTWRSIVNRVWQHHFGHGLVPTSNDFGRMGERPSHPALLDDLARRFRDGGGSLKALHREIVLSATYRQSSMGDPQAARIDAGNRLLWRFDRRRLEAEELRDAVLAAAGNLDPTMGGPGFRLFGFEDDHSPRYLYAAYDVDDPHTFRRSVYRFVVRSVPDPWMTTFDAADPSACTAVRSETTTPLQSLALLNDRFVLRQAERLAQRALDEAPEDPVGRAVQLAWQRPPDALERSALERHAEAHGMAAVCRVLLNSNEFLYVD